MGKKTGPKKILANDKWGRKYEPTGRSCKNCGKEVERILDKHGVVIFDHYFYCHREACKKVWQGENGDRRGHTERA